MRAIAMMAAGMVTLAGCAPGTTPLASGPGLQHDRLFVHLSGSATSPILYLSRPAHAAVFVVGDGYARLLDAPLSSRQWTSSGHHDLGSALRFQRSLGGYHTSGGIYLVAIASDAPLRSEISQLAARRLAVPVAWRSAGFSSLGLQREIAALALTDPSVPWHASVLRLESSPSLLAQRDGRRSATYTVVCPDGRRFVVPAGYRLDCPPPPGEDDGAQEEEAVRPPRQRPVPTQADGESGQPASRARPAAPRPSQGARPAAERSAPERPAAQRPARRPRPAAEAPPRRPQRTEPAAPRAPREREDATR